LLSGDISTNPGPVKYPCGKCSKPVKRNQRGIYCEDCTYWYHIKCIDLPIDEYQRLSTSSESWYCANCILPIFSNSFFNIEDVEDKSNAPTVTSGVLLVRGVAGSKTMCNQRISARGLGAA
jgi:hypothetical protein